MAKNTAPTAVTDSSTARPTIVQVIPVRTNDTDPDGDPISVSTVSTPTKAPPSSPTATSTTPPTLGRPGLTASTTRSATAARHRNNNGQHHGLRFQLGAGRRCRYGDRWAECCQHDSRSRKRHRCRRRYAYDYERVDAVEGRNIDFEWQYHLHGERKHDRD